MNEDVKKNLRTQGKYSDKVQKSRDKRQKESPEDPPGKKSYSHKRNSSERKGKNSAFDEESEKESPVKYEENSNYSFSELEDAKKPLEIKSSGLHTLSETSNGISTILYQPNFLEEEEGDELFQWLLNTTHWNTKNIIIRGEEYPQPRLVAWYGPFPYTYSGVTLEAAEMTDSVLAVKERIEDFLKAKGINVTLNSVLLNYYRDGHDSVAWHSDDELTMGICPTIASISLGAVRKFEMKRKGESYGDEVSDEDIDECFINLTHGSLLIMNGSMQDDWLHRVPKEYHGKTARINLTFRTVYSLDKSLSGISAKDFKRNPTKRNSSDRLSGSKINFDDNEFPPLSSSVPYFCPDNDESPQNASPNSNLPFPINEESNKSMECSDVENSNQISNNYVSKDPNSDANPFVNNLNDGSEFFKHCMQNKNIQSNDSFPSENDSMNADDTSDRNQSFDSSSYTQDEPMNVSIDSSVNVSHKNVYADILEQKYSSNLNVDAEEFIPVKSPVPALENIYSNIDLENLIQHNIELMESDQFWEYAHAIRDSVLIHIHEFRYYVKDEASFLCKMMEKKMDEFHQRLLTERLCKIVEKAFDNYYSPKFSNSSYTSRSQGSYLRQEHRESQRDFIHSAKGKRYSNRGERRTNQEDTYSNRERRTNQEDTYSNKGERRTSQEDTYSNKEERRTSQDDTYSSRGEGCTSQEDTYSNRGEKRTSQEDTYSNRGRRPYNRGEGYTTRGERHSNRGEGRSSRGEGRSGRGDGSSSRGKRSFRQ